MAPISDQRIRKEKKLLGNHLRLVHPIYVSFPSLLFDLIWKQQERMEGEWRLAGKIKLVNIE